MRGVPNLNLDVASQGNQHLKAVLMDVTDRLDSIEQQSGAAALGLPPINGAIAVTGLDGHFIVNITPPGQRIGRTVLQQAQQASDAGLLDDTQQYIHQVQSATDPKFDNNSNVTSLPPAPDVKYDLNDPNQTKYWRFRSSNDNGQTYNDWTYLTDPAVCGVVAVWSGLKKNASLVLNNAATTPTGATPLTQDGVTTNIKVAASIWKAGTDQILNYNPGQVDPGVFGTFKVYTKDPRRAAAVAPLTVTFTATTTDSDLTSDDSIIYFGKITTSGGGGGSGSGGGGGTCCRAGVPYRRFNGTNQDCSTLKVGDDLLAADGGREIIQSIILHPDRPCFHLEFDASGKLTVKTYIGDFTVYQIELDRSHTFIVGSGNVIDGACSTHTIQRLGGGFTDVFGAVVDELFNIIGGGCCSHNYVKA